MQQMQFSSASLLRRFNNLIGIRFQLYNSLFTSLPFHRVGKTGTLLSLFLIHCEEAFQKGGESPSEIIDNFLERYTDFDTEKERIDLLFRFIQYAERQVVLFDALEDAAFPQINDMQGPGTLKHLLSAVSSEGKQEELKKKLKDFSVRLVLTAHPTQFYTSEVLGIIHDLSNELISNNDPARINTLLRQLGKTPFLKKKKPTPYDEAISLIWYLENIFYKAAGRIADEINNQYLTDTKDVYSLIRMGFWPGGDRDGNPFVDAETSIKVSGELRSAILRCYYEDIKELRARLTFKGVEDLVIKLEKRVYDDLFLTEKKDLTKSEIIGALSEIKRILRNEHNDLFVELVDELIAKVELFGLFFASLDIRQDSKVHRDLLSYLSKNTDVLPDNYDDLSESERMDILAEVDQVVDPDIFENDRFQDVLKVIHAIKKIQDLNGEEGCNRYIISHSTRPLDLLEVYAFFKMGGWKEEEMKVDIIPLFESVEDLQRGAEIMEELYKNKTYRAHLKRRGNVQTIMLGFSDGTKDGGFLMANWSIYKAKESLTAISKKYDIVPVFFDGRGGPPARGGGKSHRFFASLGNKIASKEIQLTIQGQTVSSNFGTIDSAQYNLEQLVHAGISNDLFKNPRRTLDKDEEILLQHLADESYAAYCVLKNDPLFLEYLNYASPLEYYGKTNIGSRPSKRTKTELSLDSLRMVPFVGSWHQMKQIVPGYYGLGSALEKLEGEGKWKELQALYKNSMFLKALLDNCEMSMKKSFFQLTAFLADHPRYGKMWNMIHDEFEKTRTYLLKLNGNSRLMEDYPVERNSIEMRERIILPLVTIQQYALTKIRTGNKDNKLKDIFEKLVIRCSFGIINAGRNSA